MTISLPKRVPFRGVLLAVVAGVVLSAFHPYPYDNVVTRWALARQAVEHHTLQIDPWAARTVDRAEWQGHSYCDKAVLTSLLAAIVHTPVYVFASLAGVSEPKLDAAARYLAERAIGGGALVALIWLLCARAPRDGAASELAALAVGVGSILLPYATLLYGHVLAAALLFASWSAQRDGRHRLADATGALAVATEYPVALLFAGLLAYRGRAYWNVERGVRVAAFSVLAATPQLLHNALAFGSPLTFGYALEGEAEFASMAGGTFGFGLPSASTVHLLLLSPARGLLVYMPWTLLGFAGFFRAPDGARRGLGDVLRHDPRPLLVLGYVALFSAYFMASGGWAFGPRHLIPIIPLLASGLPNFAAHSRSRSALVVATLLPAIAQALLGVWGEVHQPVAPGEIPVPLPQLTIGAMLLAAGHHSVWVFGSAGTVVLAISVLALWLHVALRAGLHPGAGVALALWGALAFAPGREWSGSTDYYRGVLTAHRGEVALAARYFEAAVNDDGAPPHTPTLAREYRAAARAER